MLRDWRKLILILPFIGLIGAITYVYVTYYARPTTPVTTPSNTAITMPAPLSNEGIMHTIIVALSEQRGATNENVKANLALAKLTMDPKYAKAAVLTALRQQNSELAIKPAVLWANLRPNELEAQQYASSLLLLADKKKQAKPYVIRVLTNTVNASEIEQFAKVIRPQPFSKPELIELNESLTTSPIGLRNLAIVALDLTFRTTKSHNLNKISLA